MNLERIVALKPDLVLAWRGGNAERQVNQLSSLGIKVIWVETGSIEQIIHALQMLAPWSPQPETARQAAQAMQDDYRALKARYANAPKKTRISAVWRQPAVHQQQRLDPESSIEPVRWGKYFFAASRVPTAAGQPRTGAVTASAGDRHHQRS